VNFAQLLFPDFSLILLGFLICTYTPLGRNIWGPVESLVYYVLFPVLLFQSIVKHPLDVREASSLIGAGLLMGVSGIAMAYSLPHLPFAGRYIDKRDHAGAAQVAFRFNSFIALALAERIAGARGLQMLAVLIGFCVPLFNLGAVWPMARHGGSGLVRALLRNPLIVATVSGLAANLLGLHLPSLMEPVASRIGASSIALGLMTAGAGLQLGTLSQDKVLTAGVLSIRHFFTPLVAWLMVRVFALDADQAAVLLIFSALPASSSSYVLAVRMGYNGAYVAGLVTLSTVLGMASLPFALGVLR
jgi:malonate transporter and related proteins